MNVTKPETMLEDSLPAIRASLIVDKLKSFNRLAREPELPVQGKLKRKTGMTLVASGCNATIGSRCRVQSQSGHVVETEVVGFADESLYLMPIGRLDGLSRGARVIPANNDPEFLVGDELLGRVIDGTGKPIDEKGELKCKDHMKLTGAPINPFNRKPISEPLDVGVRAINGLFSIGRGQRIGLFAGSGVGKSVLLGQMTRHTDADVVVVGLIGERGREVREFVDHILGPKDLAKAIVVATPADDPPLLRMHGALFATAIAEYFSKKGKHVLLLMDSLTRFAQAQREIALAIGEPPVSKGYPPSVFAQIPQLVERVGNSSSISSGSITAIYTVLVEGDDQNEPIADATRAILDGHIVLNRSLAEQSIYPAISVESSTSRVMDCIISDEHKVLALRFKKLYSIYEQNRDLISVGAYKQGSDPEIDLAISFFAHLQNYISQDAREKSSFSDALAALRHLLQPEESNHEEIRTHAENS